MENILMRYFRDANFHTHASVARKLGMPTIDYKNLENGNTLMTPVQAKQLGNFYKVSPTYFYEAAKQLDLILTQKTVIKILKSRIVFLEGSLQGKSGWTELKYRLGLPPFAFGLSKDSLALSESLGGGNK